MSNTNLENYCQYIRARRYSLFDLEVGEVLSCQFTVLNVNTKHAFASTNTFSAAIKFYHKIPRRKKSTIAIRNNVTGEIVRSK
jgi:hypothetical protein